MLQRRFTAQKLAPGALVLLAMQHVLVMYSGAIAPPLIIAAALKLPKATAAYLIAVSPRPRSVRAEPCPRPS